MITFNEERKPTSQMVYRRVVSSVSFADWQFIGVRLCAVRKGLFSSCAILCAFTEN